MNKVPNIPWWASMGFHKPEPAPDTDYADEAYRYTTPEHGPGHVLRRFDR